MEQSTLVVGSLDALRDVLAHGDHGLTLVNADVVVVPTAAAFIGAAKAAVLTADAFNGVDARVEALMVTDRASNAQDYFVERLTNADVVVLCDGSPLHARLVWRNSPVGDAINAARSLVAVGAVATVLGDVMVDPRGGAPMVGLGYRSGAAICAPASDDQMTRTRSLLTADVALIVVGPSGVLRRDDDGWRVVSARDVVVTRGTETVTL